MFDFFKNLFPDKKEAGVPNNQTVPMSGAGSGFVGKRSLSQTFYRVASCQSTGMERPHNEDTLFTLNTLLGGIDAGIAFGIYLVADGMGGHQSGEVASHLAARGASQYLLARVFEPYFFERKTYQQEDVFRLLNEAVEEAQVLIQRRVPGGGTTLTLVLALGDALYSAHVGDSRLYSVGRDGKMTLRTKDHSLVKRLVDLGEITEAEAQVHPQRNVLYRALGQMETLAADLDHFKIEQGEALLICSDGLWGVLEAEQMQAILASPADLDAKAAALVRAANDAGGPDNITVVLVEKVSS